MGGLLSVRYVRRRHGYGTVGDILQDLLGGVDHGGSRLRACRATNMLLTRIYVRLVQAFAPSDIVVLPLGLRNLPPIRTPLFLPLLN